MPGPRIAATLAATLTLIGVLAACAPVAVDPDQETRTLTLGEITTSAQNFDPRFAPGYVTNAHPVYETLMSSSETASGIVFTPLLATEWTFNEDFSVLSITLRDDVDFIDGEHLDAEAVKTNIDYQTSLEDNIYTGIGLIDSTVTGEYTLDLSLDTKDGPERFIAFLACMSIASPVALEDPAALESTPVGTGPYILDVDESTAGVEYVYTRNAEYWDPDSYPFDTVVVKTFPDVVAAVNALKSGQIDVTPINADTGAEVESAGFQVIAASGSATGLLLGDRAGTIHPAFADVRVRQAMNYAFDREAIADAVFKGYATPSAQVWGVGWPEYDPALEDRYPYDPGKARDLLAEAGYPDGFDLTIPTVGFPDDPIIQQSLADIGIRVTYEQVLVEDFLGEFYHETSTPTHPVMHLFGGFENMITLVVKADGALNGWRYEDPVAIELAEVVNFGSPDESAAAARELGEYLVEEAWLVILTHPQSLWGAIPELDIKLRTATGNVPFLRDIQPAS